MSSREYKYTVMPGHSFSIVITKKNNQLLFNYEKIPTEILILILKYNDGLNLCLLKKKLLKQHLYCTYCGVFGIILLILAFISIIIFTTPY